MKNKNIFLLFFTIILLFLNYSKVFAYNNLDNKILKDYNNYEKAIVLKSYPFDEEDEYGNKTQIVKIKFLSGSKKGEVLNVENSNSNYLNINMDLKKGDKVLILENKTVDGNFVYSVSDYLRTDSIYLFILIFIFFLLLIGRKKGFLSVLSLFLTFAIIIFIAIPLIIKGYNSIQIAIISSIFIANLTIFIVGGFNKKSISAILGTCFGTIIAGCIAYFIGLKIHLTGLSMEESQMFLFLPNGIKIDPKDILFVGIIWGSLGAVMDVGMSVSSSIFEVASVNKDLSFKDLLKSGMNVGRDIMATMSNTLILAYLGSALPLVLIMILFNESNYKIINLDVIATEIIRSISGSLGLIMSIPITAIIASFLIIKNKKSL